MRERARLVEGPWGRRDGPPEIPGPVELPPGRDWLRLFAMSTSPHHWNFFRTGGLDQASLTTGADLLALEHLDQKLWVALSCPVQGLELDE